MHKIYLYKNKNCSITAEVDFNGFYTIFQNTKKVFGNSYEQKRLIDSLTRAQVLSVKKDLKAQGII